MTGENRPYHTLSVPQKMIGESALVLIVHKRGSGKLLRAAREIHLRQVDVKRPNRTSGIPAKITSPTSRLFAQVDFRREMRPIAFVTLARLSLTIW